MTQKLIHKRLSIKLYFKWYDFWIGWYYDPKMHALYVCLLPMLPIRLALELEPVRMCPDCHIAMRKVAVLDEGWNLEWECPQCADTEEYPWPYGEETISSRQLEDAGFEII
jgi:hypothetical protein